MPTISHFGALTPANGRFQATRLTEQGTALGRNCELERKRSGRRRDADRLARALRPQYLVQQPFESPLVTETNDCFVTVSVSTARSGHRRPLAVMARLT